MVWATRWYLMAGFSNHALVELLHHAALDFLPGGLASGNGEAALGIEIRPALGQFGVGGENVRRPLGKINAHPVARAQQGKTAPGGGFRRGIEDGRGARRARLAPVADAGSAVMPCLMRGRGAACSPPPRRRDSRSARCRG